MTGGSPPRIGLFGIGEAGSAIAADLVATGAEVSAFDPAKVDTPAGVVRCKIPGDAVRGKDMVMAATAANDAREAIQQALDALPHGAIYADLSTAPPSLKADLASTAFSHGLRFVDVALMAPVAGRGLSTPSLASGAGAEAYGELINAIGGDVEVVGEEPGAAATRKLLRSVVTKGLTATVLEAVEGAARFELDDWLWEHIAKFLEDADRATLERLVLGTVPHIERRMVEMSSAAAMLESVDVAPIMVKATEEGLERLKSGDRRQTIEGLVGDDA